MNFAQFTGANAHVYTPTEQAAAWDAYISQDPYLSKHRGQYAQRGAVFLPMVKRWTWSLSQDLFHTHRGEAPLRTIRLDIINFGNLLNHNWGVSQRLVSNSPLTNPAADANGALSGSRFARHINNLLMDHTYEQTTSLNDAP